MHNPVELEEKRIKYFSELVLHIESMNSRNQYTNEKVGKLLINYVIDFRNSQETKDETVIYSAIRRGAAALSVENINLLPLLESNHTIDTTLVTLKMIGRIYDVHPPKTMDENSEMSHRIKEIAFNLLNHDAMHSSKCRVKIELSLYSLTGMGSSLALDVAKEIKKLDSNNDWFIKSCTKDIDELLEKWKDKGVCGTSIWNNVVVVKDILTN